MRVPYRCGSWRHRGRCAKEKNHSDFTRIASALDGRPPEHVLLCVLTFKNREWSNPQQAYGRIVDGWRQVAKRLRRQWGAMQYVATVEKTGAGFPHLNVIMVAPALGQVVAEHPRLALAWLKKCARRHGFGWRNSLEVARSKRHVAGYIVKLADASGLDDDAQQLLRGSYGHQRTAGEVAKLSQAPTNAPKGFRRLRASPGFLPKVAKESEYTGELCTAPLPETQEAQQDAARFDALMAEQTLTTAELAAPPVNFLRMVEHGPPEPVGQGNRQRVDLLHVEAPPGEELFDGVGQCEGQQWRDGRLYLANELGGRAYWENTPANWALDAEADARAWLDANAPGWREEYST